MIHRRIPRLAVLFGGAGMCFLTSCGGNERLFVDLTPDAERYCRSVSFPRGWRYPWKDDNGLPYGTPISDFEFRQMSSGAVYFVGGVFDHNVSPYDPTNKYKLDLSVVPPKVTDIDEATWRSALKVPLVRKSIFNQGGVRPNDQAVFKGHTLPKTGPLWVSVDEDATRLSPDEAWIVLLSHTNEVRGRAYFDVFRTATGEKAVTIEGRFVTSFPITQMRRSFWLTVRHFMIPVGEDLEGMVVCEFGG